MGIGVSGTVDLSPCPKKNSSASGEQTQRTVMFMTLFVN
jgi:hypothetical protein